MTIKLTWNHELAEGWELTHLVVCINVVCAVLEFEAVVLNTAI